MAGQSLHRKTKRTRSRGSRREHSRQSQAAAEDAIKTAEEVALAAFASGLKIAAAFGTVAAKTTSFALNSLATGADKFSDLVKAEAMQSSRPRSPKGTKHRRNGGTTPEK